MPTVNLELQMKFLKELEDALSDALGRYSDDGAEKLAELKYMQNEVLRARRIISERLETGEKPASRTARISDGYQEAAYT